MERQRRHPRDDENFYVQEYTFYITRAIIRILENTDENVDAMRENAAVETDLRVYREFL